MNKNKVAIMTWHRYQNYGTSLQVTAMSHIIRRLGYSATVIDYTPKAPVRECIPLSSYIGRVLRRLKNIGYLPYDSEERTRKFDTFLRENLVYTERLETYSELNSLNCVFDAFVCGSDQIWAPTCFDDKYFLSFVDTPEKMVAYAPSIGLTSIKSEFVRKHMNELISRFVHLSVREEQGKALLKEEFDIDSQVVLDPTLLLSSNEWDEIIQSLEAESIIHENMPSEYGLCYFLGNAKRYIRYIRSFASDVGFPFFFIPVSKSQKNECPDLQNIPFEVGPAEFVALVKHAKHVITDSFHGLAFSIIYDKEVSVFERFSKHDKQNQNSRIYNLLEKAAMNHRLINFKSGQPLAKESTSSTEDLNRGKHSLHSEIKGSINYFSNALVSAVSATRTEPLSLIKEKENKELIFHNRDLCCGCGACASVCPTDSITIRRNDNGFYHYCIDLETCVSCGKCRKVCPFINDPGCKVGESVGFYSAKSMDEKVLLESSSGGIAHEISNYMINQNMSVVGCAYDSDCETARHIVINPTNKAKLSKLQGSKYIQSDFHSIISQVVEISNAVVIGTPCQIAGLSNLLKDKKKRDSFILVDLICHGVPTAFLWEKYLQRQRRVNGKHEVEAKATLDVRFRSKDFGWRELVLTLDNGLNVVSERQRNSEFYAFFEQMNCYMETCYECPYREHSKADIRLGDYWGDRFEDDSTGVSMVLAMTERGKTILRELSLSRAITLVPQNPSEYYSVQFPYNQQPPAYYDHVLNGMRSGDNSLDKLRKEYCRVPEFIRYSYRTYARIKRRLVKK